MKTILDQEDVEQIALRVVEMMRPFLAIKENSENTIFSVEELAEYLRVSVKWVYDHVCELPHFKLGGLLRFRKQEIDSAIDKLALKAKLNKAS